MIEDLGIVLQDLIGEESVVAEDPNIVQKDSSLAPEHLPIGIKWEKADKREVDGLGIALED